MDEVSNKEDQERNKNNESQQAIASYYKDLDGEFERELCDLWDMTVEKDVCSVLDEHNAVQIFEGYMRKYDSIYPRAVEILIGIMTNMASICDKIRLKLASNRSFMDYLLFDILCGMSDVPTIIQVVRLFDILLICDDEMASNSTKTTLIDYLKTDLDSRMDEETTKEKETHLIHLIEKLNYILEQSLNAQLLDCSISLLSSLIDSDDFILNAFLTQNGQFIDAICCAALTRLGLDNSDKQTINANFTSTIEQRNGRSKSVESQTPIGKQGENPIGYYSQLSQNDLTSIDQFLNKYFLCLQTISTCEQGVIALNAKSDSIVGFFDKYLEIFMNMFNDWEVQSANSLGFNLVYESIRNLVCISSVLNTLDFGSDEKKSIFDEPPNKAFVIKLLTFLNYYLNYLATLQAKKSTQQMEQSEEDELDAEIVQMAKTSVKELIENLGFLHNQKCSSSLTRLLESCEYLLKV